MTTKINVANKLLFLQMFFLVMALIYPGIICIIAKFPGIGWVFTSLIMGILVIIFERIVLNSLLLFKLGILQSSFQQEQNTLKFFWLSNILVNIVFFFKFSFSDNAAMILFTIGIILFVILSGITVVFKKTKKKEM